MWWRFPFRRWPFGTRKDLEEAAKKASNSHSGSSVTLAAASPSCAGETWKETGTCKGVFVVNGKKGVVFARWKRESAGWTDIEVTSGLKDRR